MTDELMERVCASNPLPHGSTAPPFETVRARARAEDPSPIRRRRRGRPRWARLLVPTASVAVAILVLVVAVTDLHAGHRASVSSAGHPRRAIPPSRAPRSGMGGLVLLAGAGFPSADRGLISIQQCISCRGTEVTRPGERYWLASTNDGGRAWTVSRRGYYLQQPMFEGANGWAGGLQATGPRYVGIARYYVTHDGGRTWSVAPAAAPNEGGSNVSLAGGEVWATGLSDRATILHAPVTGSRLTATTAQPVHSDTTGLGVVAAGPGTAYAWNGDARDQIFVTHDGGRSWQRITPPCPAADGAGGLEAAYGATVWAECDSTHGSRVAVVIARSESGGRSWQRFPRLEGDAWRIEPVSARVAWALEGTGTILRTTNGGRSWSSLWSAGSSHLPKAVAEMNVPLLVAQSPNAASYVTLVTRGREHGHARFTNVLLDQTTDGGRSWTSSIVPLAGR